MNSVKSGKSVTSLLTFYIVWRRDDLQFKSARSQKILQKVFGNREMFYNQLMPSQDAPSTDFNGLVSASPITWLFLDTFWHKKSHYVRAALKKSLISLRDAEVFTPHIIKDPLPVSWPPSHSHSSRSSRLICLFCTFPETLSRSVCITMNSECAPQTIREHQKRNGSAPFLQPGLWALTASNSFLHKGGIPCLHISTPNLLLP